jgi:hypothetical protein
VRCWLVETGVKCCVLLVGRNWCEVLWVVGCWSLCSNVVEFWLVETGVICCGVLVS